MAQDLDVSDMKKLEGLSDLDEEALQEFTATFKRFQDMTVTKDEVRSFPFPFIVCSLFTCVGTRGVCGYDSEANQRVGL